MDIVFVHGLTGDRERTWKSSHSDTTWPKDLMPESIPQSRILTFGYNAYVVRSGGLSNNKVRDHARNLVNELARVRTSNEERSRPIIFVTHSLGGIVCKDALQVSINNAEPHLSEMATLTRVILFAATPHEGSSLVQWAEIPLSIFEIVTPTSTSLLSVLHTDSEVADRIRDDFLNLLQKRKSEGPPFDVTCLYETLTTTVIGPKLSAVVPGKLSSFEVVSPESAKLSGHNSISVRANHRDIVRFDSEKDEGFQTIAAELQRWVHKFGMEYGEVAGIDPRIVRPCVDSLVFTQLHDRHVAIEREAEETCAWILEDKRYQAWRAREELYKSNSLLWIKGKPGSGKSTLMKFLCDRTSTFPNAIRIVFFFNARGVELEKTLLGLYRGVILQMLIDKRTRSALKPFLAKLEEKEEIFGEGKYVWLLTELQDAFQDMLTSGVLPPIELFVDALDECDENQMRSFVQLVSRCATTAIAKNLILNGCWSSRHYPTISTPYSFEIHMEEQNEVDIRKFVCQELSACDTIGVSDFEDQIVAKARGVFLWAALVVHKLVKAADSGTPTRVMLSLLQMLPMELNDLLREIFYALDPTYRSETLHLIQWVLFGKRPLFIEEVELALEFSGEDSPNDSAESSLSELLPSPQSYEHFALPDGNPAILDQTGMWLSHVGESYAKRVKRRVTALSCGLIEVVGKYPNRQWLQFIHETVRDFVLQSEVHAYLGMDLHDHFALAGEQALFDTLRRFISCPEFNCFRQADTSRHFSSRSKVNVFYGYRWTRHPFTRYAVHHLIEHATEGSGFHRYTTHEHPQTGLSNDELYKEKFPRLQNHLNYLDSSLDESDIAYARSQVRRSLQPLSFLQIKSD